MVRQPRLFSAVSALTLAAVATSCGAGSSVIAVAAGDGSQPVLEPPDEAFGVIDALVDGGALNAEPDTIVSVVFNEPLASTDPVADVMLLDVDRQELVPTEPPTIEGATLTLRPVDRLTLGAPYRIALGPDIQSLDGDRLEAVIEAGFRVRDGEWTDVVVVDPNDDDLQFLATRTSTSLDYSVFFVGDPIGKSQLLESPSSGDGWGVNLPVSQAAKPKDERLDRARTAGRDLDDMAIVFIRKTMLGDGTENWSVESRYRTNAGWESPQTLSTHVDVTLGVTDVQIAVGSDGDCVAAWRDLDEKLIHVARREKGAKTWTLAPTISSGNLPDHRRNPLVAQRPDGTFVVLWTPNEDGTRVKEMAVQVSAGSRIALVGEKKVEVAEEFLLREVFVDSRGETVAIGLVPSPVVFDPDHHPAQEGRPAAVVVRDGIGQLAKPLVSELGGGTSVHPQVRALQRGDRFFVAWEARTASELVMLAFTLDATGVVGQDLVWSPPSDLSPRHPIGVFRNANSMDVAMDDLGRPFFAWGLEGDAGGRTEVGRTVEGSDHDWFSEVVSEEDDDFVTRVRFAPFNDRRQVALAWSATDFVVASIQSARFQ